MRVLLTGGTGMLGRALRRLAPLQAPGMTLLAPDRAQLDLTDRTAVAGWFAAHPVDVVIHAAARVGGIQANIDDPTGFLVDNLDIWGTGKARREFLDVERLARFILAVLPRLDRLPPLLNVGADVDHSVDGYYRMVAERAGWQGRFTHDPTRPERMQAKLMSSARARRFGWVPPSTHDLLDSIDAAIAACRRQKRSARPA